MGETFFCQVILLFVTPLIVMSNEYDECGAVNKNVGHFAISDTRVEDIYAPWLASVVQYYSVKNVTDYRVICSGSILTVKIIVTAAHCFKDERYLPSHIRVGGNRKDNRYVVERKIQEYKRHPNYRKPEYYFDVAVIIMDNDLSFSQRIQSICLPQNVSSYPGANSHITIQGWGIDDDGNRGESASEVSVGIRSIPECNHRFKDAGPFKDRVNDWLPDLIKENILFCAESDLNTHLGTCTSDSGGPAIQK